MPTDHRGAIATLRASNDHLAKLVVGLDGAALTGPSYCSEWTVAEVLSHLGSGAEIGLLGIRAARAGAPAPERELYPPIWDRWNAKRPRAMVEDSIASTETFVAELDSMSDEELEALRVPFFDGRLLNGEQTAGMRLVEHAVHTWDVEVMQDEAAAIQPAAVGRIVKVLPQRAARLLRGERPEGAVAIRTTAPELAFVLSFGEEPALTPGEGEAGSTLSLPAEALIRLLYGRLDPAHTPPTTTSAGPVDLEALRAAYTGS